MFSVMWTKFLMTSDISGPVWLSVYEWSVIYLVRTECVLECGMFVMYCMQCCMSVSALL